MQKNREGFNWLLPLFGAIGFGVGFALIGAIDNTIFEDAKKAFTGTPNPRVGMIIGAVVGLGGIGLGLAFKDKIQAVYFGLAGCAGFAIAFALLLSLNSSVASNLGWAIIRFMGGRDYAVWVSVANGLGMGAIVGGIGGLVLGLASPKGRIVSALLLCLAGAVSFAIVFAFGNVVFHGDLHSSWNAWGGAIVGAVLGSTLATFYLVRDRAHPKPDTQPGADPGASSGISAAT